MLSAEIYKKQLIEKMIKSGGSIHAVTEITPSNIHLTFQESAEILGEYYKKRFSGIEDWFFEALVKKIAMEGIEYVDNKDDKNGVRLYPVIDKNYGLVLAPSHVIHEASYTMLEMPKKVNITKCIKHLLNDDSLHFQDIIDEKMCFCGSVKEYAECCYNTKIQYKDISNLQELQYYIESPIPLGTDEETIIAEYLYKFIRIYKAVIDLDDIHISKKRCINEITLYPIGWAMKLYTIEKFPFRELADDYLALLTYAIKPNVSIKNINKRKINVFNVFCAKFQNLYTWENYLGFAEQSLKKLKDLFIMTERASELKIDDYSLFTLGFVTILEKELNEVRKLLLNAKDVKPLTLYHLFEYFRGIKDSEVIERIAPLIYSLRFIRENELDELVRITRNEIAHGSGKEDSYSEYMDVRRVCLGGSPSLFKSISTAKLTLQNKNIIDKDKITRILIEKIKFIEKSQCNLGFMYDKGRGVEQNEQEVAEWYRKAVEQGNAAAQYNLGYFYAHGEGVKQDYKEAAKWYRKAAEQGYPKAQYNLGCSYAHGEGVKQDYKEAAKWYRKAAEQGYPKAQYNLGCSYSNGEGVEQNHKEAAKWYRKAAEQGYPKAQYNLGCSYSNGEGVEQNHDEAAKWYRKAAEQGNVLAQRELGYLYYIGKGIEQDYEEAAGWYRKAAEQGNAVGQGALGLLYDRGEGVEQDYEEAVKWYRKAAEQGNAASQCNLGNCYESGKGIEQSDREAAEWYRKAAEQGLAIAQYNLGCCYDNGKGVEQSDNEAVEWYRKAAKQGHATAQNNMGNSYARGKGVEQNHLKAAEWLRKAAEQGHEDAQYNLGLLYATGKGVEPNHLKAAKWLRKAAEQGHANAQDIFAILYETEKCVSTNI